jgi:hypothetical protein
MTDDDARTSGDPEVDEGSPKSPSSPRVAWQGSKYALAFRITALIVAILTTAVLFFGLHRNAQSWKWWLLGGVSAASLIVVGLQSRARVNRLACMVAIALVAWFVSSNLSSSPAREPGTGACTASEWETIILVADSAVVKTKSSDQANPNQPSPATLVISFVRNEYDQTQGTYKPTLKIRSDGYQECEISGQDVGYMKTYSADCAYDIQLLATYPNEVRIRVARKPLGKTGDCDSAAEVPPALH